MKPNRLIFVVVLAIFVVIVTATIYYLQNKPIRPGSDRDKHGCIGSAGYSWCEQKNKCLRIWEEKCE